MPTIIDGSGSATFQTPLPLAQGGSGNTTGNVASSQVADAFNATGSAPLFACRAWVNFNGTGTVAIRASGNVSSITDNGTGDYTVNFATAMTDSNYAVAGFLRQTNTGSYLIYGNTNTGYAAGSMRLNTSTVNASLDSDACTVAIFR
jgi:hypothetical protein